MTECVYNAHGSAVGFHCTRYVYRLDGSPIGQLNGKHVHKLSGEYIGELCKDAVVINISVTLEIRATLGTRATQGTRGAVNYGDPDVFRRLFGMTRDTPIPRNPVYLAANA